MTTKMTMTKPRWLTFPEICEELRLPPDVVIALIRAGRLMGLVSKKSSNTANWRILDPSVAYKMALSAQENIVRNRFAVDLMEYPVIATGEFAQLTGLAPASVRNLVRHKKLIPCKMGRYSLFTASQVREVLLKRERKEPTDRRARCEHLVRWCLKMLETHALETITEAQVHQDDALEGSLRRIMRQQEPERGKHLAEFWRRFELAQAAARSIQKRRAQKK